MPLFVHGTIVCDECGKTIHVRTCHSQADGARFLWRTSAPPPWVLLVLNQSITRAYCSLECRPSTSPGAVFDTCNGTERSSTYDGNTFATLMNILDGKTVSADDTLAAVEAVLTAWRVNGGRT